MGTLSETVKVRFAVHVLGVALPTRRDRSLGYAQQALYCLGKLCSLDPNNVDALWDRASIAKETGDLRLVSPIQSLRSFALIASQKARNALLSILKRYPHDMTVMFELRPILIDLADFSLCASLFQDAFDYYQMQYPSGPPPSPPSTSAGTPQSFGLLDVLVLADLHNTPALAMYDRAISAIRQGCRWLQGRGAQKFWDVCEDDREYDPPGLATRTGEVQPGGYELDVNARQRLAVARIKMGDTEEGKVCILLVPPPHDADSCTRCMPALFCCTM